jgi:DUF177 domain-containing protein
MPSEAEAGKGAWKGEFPQKIPWYTWGFERPGRTLHVDSMLLDLKGIARDQDRVERHWPPSAFEPVPEDFRIAGNVDLTFDVRRKGDEYRLSGELRAPLELACSRCLEPFSLSVDGPFDLHYLPQALNSGEDESEIAEDDLTTAFYREHAIDLGQLVREQCYLALPMKPLCRADCKGLCPVCGTNLNAGACSCDRSWTDPRLAGLKALRSDPNDTR